MLSPEHTALAGVWLAVLGAPVMGCALTLTATQATRWLHYSFAAAMTAAWLPLAVMAPTLTVQLL